MDKFVFNSSEDIRSFIERQIMDARVKILSQIPEFPKVDIPEGSKFDENQQVIRDKMKFIEQMNFERSDELIARLKEAQEKSK
jgi:hypothetical protein